MGEIPTDTLSETVTEALIRLRSGERELAVHRNCGTNLLISGFAAGIAGTAGLIGVGKRPWDKIERVPLITMFSVIALILARPLGPLFQRRFTTSGDPEGLKISSISRHLINSTPAHRIKTLD